MNEELGRIDPLSTAMWLGFVNWGIGEEAIRREFEETTGFSCIQPPKNALEAMIDEAAGIHVRYLKADVRYLTENYWGLEFSPDVYFEKFAEGSIVGIFPLAEKMPFCLDVRGMNN